MQSEQQGAAIAREVAKGLKHHRAGRLDEAERIYRGVLQVAPTNAEALHLLGLIAHQFGKHENAVQLIDRALEYQPSNAIFLSNRGSALQHLGRYDAALASYNRALAIKPDYAEALYNRGLVLQRLKRHKDAIAAYDAALKVKADYADALNNRGIALHRLARYDEAIASFDKVLSFKPDHVEALTNRANALQELNRFDDALTDYGRALQVNPLHPDAFGNRGNALQKLKRYKEALADYGRAIELRPDYAWAHVNESLCRLTIGDFERGWGGYEWRWKVDEPVSPIRHFGQPLWLGKEDIAGKTLLLHAEQGLGDTIQFARYVQAVVERRAKVVLEVQPALRSLLSTVAGVAQVVSQGERLPSFDFHCPLLSLPLALNTRLNTIPAPISYLVAPAKARKMWEDKLGKRDVPRVGIVWSGGAAFADNRHRSIPIELILRLAIPGVRLISLQKDLRPGEEELLTASNVPQYGADFKDFSDTAALASLMDLVISVDTSVAHLAGALGKPVWILLAFASDWRWLADREDSPWYPTARLFRQPRKGDWHSLIDDVRGKLAQYATSR